MIDSLRITRIFVALVVALLLPDVASGAEVCAVVSGDRGVYAHHESGGSATEYTFIGTSAPLLSTPAPHGAAIELCACCACAAACCTYGGT